MGQKKKGQYIGWVGALLVHLLLLLLLFCIRFALPDKDEEKGGVPVMLGSVEAAADGATALTEVDVLPEPLPSPAAPPVSTDVPSENDLLTQDLEESVAVKPKTTPKKPEKTPPPKKEQPKQPEKKPEKKPEELLAERKKAAEEKARREAKEAEERALQAQRAAEEAARNRVAGAFGKGAQMGNSRGTATQGEGEEGSPQGNATTGGKGQGGGYGTFDLGGRSLGMGSLPKPNYTVQAEGRVVVNITVNPAGQVVATSINPQKTNTVHPGLRKAAEEAAQKARFNTVEGHANQTGSITYYFHLR